MGPAKPKIFILFFTESLPTPAPQHKKNCHPHNKIGTHLTTQKQTNIPSACLLSSAVSQPRDIAMLKAPTPVLGFQHKPFALNIYIYFTE